MCHARKERELLFGTRSADYIRASSHSGCIATEVILQAKQAEYMAAPERFAEMPDFSLAPRAPSIHGTYRQSVPRADGRFSNRPLGVKRFQTIHHCSVDVARGLVLLFGIGARALVWGFFSQEV